MFDEQLLTQQIHSLDVQRAREQGIVVIYVGMMLEPQLDAAEQVIRIVRAVHPILLHEVFSVTFLPHTASDVSRALNGEFGAVIDLRTPIRDSQ